MQFRSYEQIVQLIILIEYGANIGYYKPICVVIIGVSTKYITRYENE